MGYGQHHEQREGNAILNFIKTNKSVYNFEDFSYTKHAHWYLEKMVYIFPTNQVFHFSHAFLSNILNAQVESYRLRKDDGTR